MKGLALLLARRYLFSRKSHSVINIISGVSAFSVGVPVAAMVILLSVFNGFEQLVKSMYKEFDPDIMITAIEGKVFDSVRLDRAVLMNFPQVEQVSMVLEDNALMEYGGRQSIATIRGVDSLYSSVSPIEKMITSGEYKLHFGDMQQAVVGQGVAYNLGVRTNLYDPITIYTPRRGKYNSLLPMANYNQERIFPAGIFMLDAETDGKYVIVPIEFTQELFDYPASYSSAMIKLKSGVDPDKARAEIAQSIGGDFKVQTRYQIKESFYKIMAYEKWGLFFITLLVLIIASFSIIGSLVMLIIEKRNDIQTLRALGCDTRFVRSIFVCEGMMIASIGAIGGVALGLMICWVQIKFGIVEIPASTFLVDSYPVIVQLSDLVGVVIVFATTAYAISKIAVLKMIKNVKININTI